MMSEKYLQGQNPEYSGPEPMPYRLHAWAFVKCAEDAIRGCHENSGRAPNMMENVPIIFLICHAVEMFLKLALYKTGSQENALKQGSLRHNLSALKEECEKVGVSFSTDVAKMIEVLSPLHEKHSLRYTAFVNPPLWLPFTTVEMVSLAKQLVGASHPSQIC